MNVLSAIEIWNKLPPADATGVTSSFVNTACAADLKLLVSSVTKQDSLTSLVLLLPNSIQLYKMACPAVVSICIKRQWHKALSALSIRAMRDVLTIFINATADITEETLTRAYALIASTMDLGVLSVQRVVKNILKYVVKSASVNVINAMYAFFGERCLFNKSHFDKYLKTCFREAKNYDMMECMDVCKAALIRASLKYPTLDLSPKNGSLWMRNLFTYGRVDNEEEAHSMTLYTAFVSRWFRFIRSRVDTKRGILLYEHEGTTLVQFAVKACMFSSLARVLVDNLVYLVSIEHPTMLPPEQHKDFLDLLFKNDMHFPYRAMLLALEKRVEEILKTAQPKFDLLVDCMHRGLGVNNVLHVLVLNPLRTQNVSTWRVLLKSCLQYAKTNCISVSAAVLDV